MGLGLRLRRRRRLWVSARARASISMPCSAHLAGTSELPSEGKRGLRPRSSQPASDEARVEGARPLLTVGLETAHLGRVRVWVRVRVRVRVTLQL